MAQATMFPMNIEIVGLIKDSNGRSCSNHSCCGRELVQSAPDRAEGKTFRLCLVDHTELALYSLTQDGGNGCRVGFARHIYAVTHGRELDGRLVRLVEVYHKDHNNLSKRSDFQRNHGFATALVLSDNDEDVTKDYTDIKKNNTMTMTTNFYGNHECALCGKKITEHKVCSSCRKVYYCDNKCQIKHWPTHRELCQKGSFIFEEDMITNNTKTCFLCENSQSAHLKEMRYQPCCGVVYCNTCIFGSWACKDPREKGQLCPHCRADNHTTKETFIERLNKRIEMNDSNAMHIMACFHFSGRWGIPKNIQKAIIMWEDAGREGCSQSFNALADMYRVGCDVKRDITKTLKYTKLAVSKGNIMATHNLALYIFFGVGVKANKEEAIRLWKSTASNGFRPSLRTLVNNDLISDDEYKKVMSAFRENTKEDIDLKIRDHHGSVDTQRVKKWIQKYEGRLTYLSTDNVL